MFTKTEAVTDWKDLQEKVSRLFCEMEYETDIGREVQLAGRGKKEIDVFVTDPNASYNRVYLIECKHWDTKVRQEIVHSFKTVMEETGANTGFIISKKGFQSGAHEAARFTNIKLLDFEELQHLYGNEWFRKQKAKLHKQVQRLNQIHLLHFDQFNNLGIHNNMFFHTEELHEKLGYFHRWVSNLISGASGIWPESYLGPEPVRNASNPFDPLWQSKDWYEFATVRDYFQGMTQAARQCADEFEEALEQAKASFDGLEDRQQASLMRSTLTGFREETPIRALKRHVKPEEYQRLLQMIAGKPVGTDA